MSQIDVMKKQDEQMGREINGGEQNNSTTVNKTTTTTNFTLQTIKLTPSYLQQQPPIPQSSSSSAMTSPPPPHPQQHTSQRSRYNSTNNNYNAMNGMPASSNPSVSLSHFRFLSSHSNTTGGGGGASERSATPSGKSHTSLNTLNNQQRVFIREVPDAVDEIKLQYEGERHVVKPGYMTSADVLRNMLLTHQTNDVKAVASAIVQRQKNAQMSLREKLAMQQQQQQQQQNGRENNRNPLQAAAIPFNGNLFFECFVENDEIYNFMMIFSSDKVNIYKPSG